MNGTPAEPQPSAPPTRSGSSGRSVRSILLLIVGVAALLVFISLVGDFRRKQNTMAQMEWHTGTYASRMGNTVELPLNLDPDIPAARQALMIKVKWIDKNDARELRGYDGPIITTYSSAIPQALGSDGRAVIVFEKGKFRVEWMDVSAFDAAMKQQDARVAELAGQL